MHKIKEKNESNVDSLFTNSSWWWWSPSFIVFLSMRRKIVKYNKHFHSIIKYEKCFVRGKIQFPILLRKMGKENWKSSFDTLSSFRTRCYDSNTYIRKVHVTASIFCFQIRLFWWNVVQKNNVTCFLILDFDSMSFTLD